MNYSVNYRIISIHYSEKTRVTEVTIFNEDTGEIFKGRAHRLRYDPLNIALGTNLALARAVKKLVLTDLADEERIVKEEEWSMLFNC